MLNWPDGDAIVQSMATPSSGKVATQPFFSVCIPQYVRTSFLLVALRVLAEQTFRDFEVCISDDCSPDGRREDIKSALRESGFPSRFEVMPRNSRYDANLRAAISLASGRYCLLMGNDDALAGPAALERLHAHLVRLGPCGVAITDFQDYATGARAGRIQATLRFGGTAETAARHFRNFSFVSGVVLERESAQNLATDRWDGSEMYQTFLGTRIIASGQALVEVAEPLVRKDIVVTGEHVESVATRMKVDPWPVVERSIPLGMLGRLVCDAVSPHVSDTRRSSLNFLILNQVIRYPYAYWTLQYRRIQSWSFALGVALGMRPSRMSAGVALRRVHATLLRVNYIAVTVAALTVPLRLFHALQPFLYRLAKAPSTRQVG